MRLLPPNFNSDFLIRCAAILNSATSLILSSLTTGSRQALLWGCAQVRLDGSQAARACEGALVGHRYGVLHALRGLLLLILSELPGCKASDWRQLCQRLGTLQPLPPQACRGQRESGCLGWVHLGAGSTQTRLWELAQAVERVDTRGALRRKHHTDVPVGARPGRREGRCQGCTQAQAALRLACGSSPRP